MRPAAWVALASLIVGGAIVAETNGDRARNRLRDTLQGFAPTYAQELQRMGHARLSFDLDVEDPAYLSMIEAEKRWLAEVLVRLDADDPDVPGALTRLGHSYLAEMIRPEHVTGT